MEQVDISAADWNRDRARELLRRAKRRRAPTKEMVMSGPRATEWSTERMRLLARGEVEPSTRIDFIYLLERWGDDLTGTLRKHGCVRADERSRGELGSIPADPIAAMREYHERVRPKGQRLLSRGVERGFAPAELLAHLEVPQTTDAVWEMHDEIWAWHGGWGSARAGPS